MKVNRTLLLLLLSFGIFTSPNLFSSPRKRKVGYTRDNLTFNTILLEYRNIKHMTRQINRDDGVLTEGQRKIFERERKKTAKKVIRLTKSLLKKDENSIDKPRIKKVMKGVAIAKKFVEKEKYIKKADKLTKKMGSMVTED